MKELKKCDCCGAQTVHGDYDICPFCGWEQDRAQRKAPDSLGANSVTLNEAKKNFRRFGRAEPVTSE